MARRERQPWEGYARKIRAPRRDRPALPRGFEYTSQAKPCIDKYNKLKRGVCHVQLLFQQGQPMLRFCATEKAPGALVPVRDEREAHTIARQACENFAETGDYGLPPELVVGLGRRRRAQSKRARPKKRRRR